MSYRDEILRRLAFLQAELGALTRLVELDGAASAPASVPASVSAAVPAPAPVVVVQADAPPSPVAAVPVAQESSVRTRWSYLPGATYRIVGENPFRSDGNNFAFFNHLRATFGRNPISWEQLAATYGALKADGTIQTDQTEDSYVKVFLRQGGVEKGRLAMVAAGRSSAPPAAKAAAPAIAPATEALPPEAGEETTSSAGWYKLKGTPSFRGDSINRRLFEALGRKRFTRRSLNELVRAMVAEGTVPSARPIPMISSEFFRFLQERGHVVTA